MKRNRLEMTDRELCVVSAVGSDYAAGGSRPDLQGELHLASAEERSCWQAGNRVLLTGTGDVIQAMAAGGSVTLRRGLKVQTMSSIRSLRMLAVESAPVGYVGEPRALAMLFKHTPPTGLM